MTKDPEVRHAGSNNEYIFADFDIAVQREYKSKDADSYETDFFRVKTSSGMAKFCEKYITKGMKVEVEGALETERWTDKENKKMQRVIIRARRVGFAESKSASKQSGNAPSEAQSDSKTSGDSGFVDVPSGIEEELPFV